MTKKIVDYLEIVKNCEDTYIINNTITNRYVKLGEREINYLLQLKGLEKWDDTKSTEQLSTEQQKLLYSKFEEWGYFNIQNVNKTKKRDASNIILVTLDTNKRFSGIMERFKVLISPIGLALLILSMAITLYAFIFESNAILLISSKVQIGLKEIIGIYILMFFTIMIHELCHATACYKYSGKTGGVGIKLFYLLPAFYCDVSNIYMAGSRKKSFIVSIVGLACNVVMSSIALLIYIVLYHYQIYCMTLLYFFVLNTGLIAYNLFPFAKFDGYWILKSVLGIDNLYDKGIVLFYECIFSLSKFSKNNMSLKRKLFLTAYGACSFIFHWLIWFYSIIGLNLTFQRYINAPEYIRITLLSVMAIIGIINCIIFSKNYYVLYKNKLNLV
jgi:putative peptide zinc metalloprotease protein